MYQWKDFRKHWYLIAATAAILAATLTLVLMQYRSARRTEAQAQAILEANLDLHLLALVAEARRDLVEHAETLSNCRGSNAACGNAGWKRARCAPPSPKRSKSFATASRPWALKSR